MSGCVGRRVNSPFPHLLKNDDVVSCCLDLTAPSISFRVNGLPVQGMLENFSTAGFLYPVVSFSAGVKSVVEIYLCNLYTVCDYNSILIIKLHDVISKLMFLSTSTWMHSLYYSRLFSCLCTYLGTRVRFLFGGHHGEFRFLPPLGFAPCTEAMLPKTKLTIESCQKYISDYGAGKQELTGPLVPLSPVTFTPTPVDISKVTFQVPFFNILSLTNFQLLFSLS